ncbi:MAG TPA: DUF3426 domain-containing protein [Candidatus Binataceae bacterium]
MPKGPALERALPPRAAAPRTDGEAGLVRPRRRPSAPDPISQASQPSEPPGSEKSLEPSSRAADPEEDNPLARSFADPEETAEEHRADRNGENLAFHFGDRGRDRTDPAAVTVTDKHDDWEVGYPPKGFDSDLTAATGPSALSDPDLGGPSNDTDGFSKESALRADSFGRASAQAPLPKPDFDSSALGSRLHSGGLFAGMIFVVMLAFGIVTVAIVASPAISAGIISNLPILGERFHKPNPAPRQVALINLRSQYHYLKDAAGGPALIITGEAHNISPSALHLIEIVVTLVGDDGRDLQRGSFYCGNAISSRTVSEMTAREISFFQALRPPAAFTLAPDAAWNFVLVFPKPPARQNRFRIAVVKADAQGGGDIAKQ